MVPFIAVDPMVAVILPVVEVELLEDDLVHPEKVVKPRKATITIIIIFFIGFFWAKLIHYSNKKRLLSVFLYILFNSAKQLFQ